MQKLYELIQNDLESINSIILNTLNNNNYVVDKICKFLNYPSKRIRTVLSLLYLKANCCTITEDILKIIAAVEIIHNASLLHDDVIDEAETRRGKKTIAFELSPKMSVIAGDLLLSKAVKLITSTKNEKIINLFITCTEDMSNAEIRQYLRRGEKCNLDEYIEICKGKTSSLFSASLKSVSELAGLDLKNAELFGEIFGIVFQIRNDLEPKSIKEDKSNRIFTIYDMFDIEKTNILIDNYKEKMRSIIEHFPCNEYKNGLCDIVDSL